MSYNTDLSANGMAYQNFGYRLFVKIVVRIKCKFITKHLYARLDILFLVTTFDDNLLYNNTTSLRLLFS